MGLHVTFGVMTQRITPLPHFFPEVDNYGYGTRALLQVLRIE